MEIVELKIEDLRPANYNPRYITEKQKAELKKSLAQFGFVSPIIVNSHPNREGVVVGGHQRLKIWVELGRASVPCILVNLTEAEERELNVRLNKNGGEFDISKLRAEFTMEELQYFGFEPFEVGADEFVLEEEAVEHLEPLEVEVEEEELEVEITESAWLIKIEIEAPKALKRKEIQAIKSKYFPNLLFFEMIGDELGRCELFHFKDPKAQTFHPIGANIKRDNFKYRR